MQMHGTETQASTRACKGQTQPSHVTIAEISTLDQGVTCSECNYVITFTYDAHSNHVHLTIRLGARVFYEVTVDKAEGRIIYHLIEIESE